jgi:hypothetical protein
MLAIRKRARQQMTTVEMSAATPEAEAVPPAPAPRHLGLRIVLIIAAVLEAFDALPSVSTLFGDMSEIPGPGFGGFLIKAHLATHPVLALGALVFAAIGRVRYAIMALGAIVLMTWLSYMPSVVRHGLGFDCPYAAVTTTAQIIAFPLMGACAIAYAARNQRLGIATALISSPTLFNLAGVIAFAVSVMIHGF